MALRISASIILLFSILYLPFWLSAILALLGMAYFSFFFEAVILFFLIDLLYGAPEAKFSGSVFVALLAALAAFIIIEFLKSRLRLENK